MDERRGEDTWRVCVGSSRGRYQSRVHVYFRDHRVGSCMTEDSDGDVMWFQNIDYELRFGHYSKQSILLLIEPSHIVYIRGSVVNVTTHAFLAVSASQRLGLER